MLDTENPIHDTIKPMLDKKLNFGHYKTTIKPMQNTIKPMLDTIKPMLDTSNLMLDTKIES